MMLTIGLTGSIAMGKSTVAGMFRNLGIPLFDSDACVHAFYCGPLSAKIAAEFPGVSVEGAIDRAQLAAHVIGNDEAMRRLEGVVHPAVAQQRGRFLQEAKDRGARMAVVDIPLLFETGSDRLFSMCIVVSAPPALQRQRALSREGMSEARFAAVLARQMPDAEKRRRAHYVIDTSGSLDDTRSQVEDFVRAIVGIETGSCDQPVRIGKSF